MYKVISEFYDLQDGCKHYLPGDTFPREGMTVSDLRLESLATDRNLCGYKLIEKVEQEETKPIKKRAKKNVD